MKKLSLGSLFVMGLVVSSVTLAQNLSFNFFTWQVAASGNVRIDVLRTPQELTINLVGPGTKLGTLPLNVKEAKDLARMLGETGKIYQQHMDEKGLRMEERLTSDSHIVYFNSNQGRDFTVSVKTTAVKLNSIKLTKDQAEVMAAFLSQADEMAKIANSRVME